MGYTQKDKRRYLDGEDEGEDTNTEETSRSIGVKTETGADAERLTY